MDRRAVNANKTHWRASLVTQSKHCAIEETVVKL